MVLAELHPFVRYVRRLTGATFPRSVPYDARLFYATAHGSIAVEGAAYPMAPGCLLYINAGVPYTLQAGDYLAVNFDLTHENSHRALPIPPLVEGQRATLPLPTPVSVTDAPALDRCLYLPACPEAAETLEALLTEYEGQLPGYQAAAAALLTGLLLQMLRTPHPQRTGLNPRAVLEYVHRHYREPLTGEQLAQQFHFHKNHISAAIRRYTGYPLHRYLLELRIRRAIPLLEEGSLSVAEVAAAVGFGDANYFSRYFKKRTGVTPLSYKGGTDR